MWYTGVSVISNGLGLPRWDMATDWHWPDCRHMGADEATVTECTDLSETDCLSLPSLVPPSCIPPASLQSVTESESLSLCVCMVSPLAEPSWPLCVFTACVSVSPDMHTARGTPSASVLLTSLGK